MPERVETTTSGGVDQAWVMQVTFVVTILVGAPIVALLSTTADLPTWGARAEFAVRIGAVLWFVTAVGVFLYARRYRSDADDPRAESSSTDSKRERQ